MAIQAGVTRNLYNAKDYGLNAITNMDDDICLLNKCERASVIDMIRVFTINGAIATFREDEIGTIEVGKKADLVVLDKNILEITPLDIENTNVIITFLMEKLFIIENSNN